MMRLCALAVKAAPHLTRRYFRSRVRSRRKLCWRYRPRAPDHALGVQRHPNPRRYRHQARNQGLNGSELLHQFAERSLARFVEQRPQAYAPFFGYTILRLFGRSLADGVLISKGSKTCSSRCNHSQATNLAVATPSQAPVMGYPAILSAVGPGRTRTRDHEVCRAALGNKRCPPAAINATDATD